MAEQESTGQKHISVEAEFEQWGSKTSFGVLAGMLYGGCKEALGSAHLGKLLAPMQEGKDVKTKRFMWRELVEQRVIRMTRGTVVGGARLGTFTAMFCGIQSSLAVRRDVHDTMNVVAAGSATAAAFGLACKHQTSSPKAPNLVAFAETPCFSSEWHIFYHSTYSWPENVAHYLELAPLCTPSGFAFASFLV